MGTTREAKPTGEENLSPLRTPHFHCCWKIKWKCRKMKSQGAKLCQIIFIHFLTFFFHTAWLGGEEQPNFHARTELFCCRSWWHACEYFSRWTMQLALQGPPVSNKICSVHLFQSDVMRLGFLKAVFSLNPARQPSISLAFCKSTIWL